jgi:nucleoside-diphosphate-sugar epimerase
LARLHYESDRAWQLLGWKPRVGVREGIRLSSQYQHWYGASVA